MKNKGYAKFRGGGGGQKGGVWGKGGGGGAGKIRCIMRNVEVAYNHKRNEKLDYTSDPKG